MLPKFNRCFATPGRDPIGSKNNLSDFIDQRQTLDMEK